MNRWSQLSQAERVGLYTRWSLYVVLWSYSGGVLLAAALDDPKDPVVLVGGGVLMAALATAAMVAALHERLTARYVVPLVVVAAAYAVAGIVHWPSEFGGVAVMVAVGSVILALTLVDDSRLSTALVVMSGVLFGINGGEVVNVVSGLLYGAALVFVTRASMWVYGVVDELDTGRQAQAQLAVMEERLRFSRDVHDVLGRRLSTIAVQAELAATLAARGDERAAERMLEVRRVAHEGLREAREIARGYRSTDFATELEGARSLLRSAGVELQSDVEEMPRAWHEAAAWVVRESVTNVLRHSRAALVEIAYRDGALVVANDGASGGDAAADGSGLRGLRERLAPLGASLDTSCSDGRWSVVATFPGSGPLSARSA